MRLGDMLLKCKLLISSKEDKERKYLSQSAVYNLTHNTNNQNISEEPLLPRLLLTREWKRNGIIVFKNCPCLRNNNT